jgi:hypothetical protein
VFRTPWYPIFQITKVNTNLISLNIFGNEIVSEIQKLPEKPLVDVAWNLGNIKRAKGSKKESKNHNTKPKATKAGKHASSGRRAHGATSFSGSPQSTLTTIENQDGPNKQLRVLTGMHRGIYTIATQLNDKHTHTHTHHTHRHTHNIRQCLLRSPTRPTSEFHQK